jgi:hypothetical protein
MSLLLLQEGYAGEADSPEAVVEAVFLATSTLAVALVYSTSLQGVDFDSDSELQVWPGGGPISILNILTRCAVNSECIVTVSLGVKRQLGGVELLTNAIFSPVPRVVGESNVVLLDGMTADSVSALIVSLGRRTGQTAYFVSTCLAVLDMYTIPSDEFGFTIVIDAYPAAATVAGRAAEYHGRLKINGEEVPFKAFEYTQPKDTLGASLSVTLVNPDLTQLAFASMYSFEIGIVSADGATTYWKTIVADGKLFGRTYSLGWRKSQSTSGGPADTLTFNAANPLADKWKLGPARPVIMYDASRVAMNTVVDPMNILRTEDGTPITPLFEPRSPLYLYDVLRRAYVTGCGFSDIRTNIANYPVMQADFTLTSGWHGGVAGLVAPYDPIYFVDDVTNELWILDRLQPLPVGFVPRIVLAKNYLTYSDTKDAGDRNEAILLQYTEQGGEAFREVFLALESTESPVGGYGSPGYTRSETQRKVRQYYNTALPAVTIREVLVEEVTTVYDTTLTIVHRATQKDQLDDRGRKTGHTRTVESLVPDPDTDALALLTALDEKCTVSYSRNPFNTAETLQDLCLISTRGMILVDEDNTYRDQPFRLPWVDAHRNGFIESSANQSTDYGPLRTRIERLRVKPDRTLDTQVTVVDHVANTTAFSTSEPRTGLPIVDGGEFGVQREVLLKLTPETVITRVVATLGALGVPRNIAIALAKRKLRMLNNPPSSGEFALAAGFDPLIHRGSVFDLYHRDGHGLGVRVCVGLSIHGETSSGKLHAMFISTSVQVEEVG